MKKILVTGATGNIGYEVLRFLCGTESCQLVAGVRNPEKARQKLKEFGEVEFIPFDFETPSTFEISLCQTDSIFLLRPPQISDTKKYFQPLVEKIKEKSVKQVVFLSVQGADKSKWVPHHKIEEQIRRSGLNYIFLRPSYFMQNLTTTLISDIRHRQKIVLPAGKAKFNWIDAQNIGETAAMLLLDFERYQNKAFELTGYENLDFYEVSRLISAQTGINVEFENLSPFSFFWRKKREGVAIPMIFVMIALHFLPRFSSEPGISNFYEQLTGKKPTTLAEFVLREKASLLQTAE